MDTSIDVSTDQVSTREPIYDVTEKSVQQLHAALSSGQVTASQLVQGYIDRIDAFDRGGPRLNSVVVLNPSALDEAAALDAERSAKGMRGPLHGIPILIKDNVDVAGLPTSGGSLAFANLYPESDAFLVQKLRAAGAIVLGKTTMHELAAGVTNASSLTGFTRNPYDPRRVPGGSSGGTAAAVAASFAAVGIGSDTCGSLRLPASCQSLYTLRLTRGLASRSGMMPLSTTQDIPGPLARTVADLAIVLDAIVGADPADASTVDVQRHLPRSYLTGIRAHALAGLRIGVLPQLFGNAADEVEVSELARQALYRMEALGAKLIEVDIPDLEPLMRASNVIAHEFRFALAGYLRRYPASAIGSLGEVIAAGLHHEQLDAVLKVRNAAQESDSEAYREAIAQQAKLREIVEACMARHGVDVLAYPALRRKPTLIGEILPADNSQLGPGTGLPSVVMPAGWTRDALPVGIELMGLRYAEQDLLSYASHWEAQGWTRVPPFSTPSLIALSASSRKLRGCVYLRERSGDEETVRVDYALDRLTAELTYEVSAGEVLADRLIAVTAHAMRDRSIGPVFANLLARGERTRAETVTLAPHQLAWWVSGDVVLRLTTTSGTQEVVPARVSTTADERMGHSNSGSSSP
ncbi:amidase [Trinickia sp. NRRL B-1857]|uniref:amidase n=1 Tax=Trinickia sp. NRRL B-1857 TaxID=3162879 RepID=UPI003D29527C